MDIDYLEVDKIVNVACSECGIPTFRANMTDDEIARVCRWIGEQHPASMESDTGNMIITAEGYDLMIFITMTEFPKFYEDNKLYMVWRN